MADYIPDDNEATLLLDAVESEPDAGRKATMIDLLGRYRDAKTAAGLEPFKPDPAIARQARERLEGLYDGLDQVDARLEPAQREGFNAAVEASADRDEVKARMVNQAWVMQEFPHLSEAVDADWTSTKHYVAKNVFGNDATEIPDTAFYGQIGGRIKQQKAEREMMTEVLTKIQVEAAKGTGTWLDAWKKAATGLSANTAWNPDNHDRYRAAAQKVFADAQKQTEALRPAITAGQEFYKLAAAGTAEMEVINATRQAFLEELKRLPQAEQEQALTLAIAGSTDLAPKPRGEEGSASLPEKMTVGLERAIGEFPRSVFRLGKAAGAAGAELAATVRVGAGTGTAEELYRVQRGARDIELERKIDQGLRDAVDPIASKNRLAQGMIDAMDSVPYMVSASTGAGIPLTLAAMAEDNRAKFVDAGVPEAEAMTLGLAAAAPQVAVERLQANMVFKGKLPGLDKWMTKIVTTKAGLATKMLAVAGMETAQQNIEEAVQDITPAIYQELGSALSADVPEVKWAEEMAAYKNGRVDTFFALLPMVMLGTGTASFKEAAFAREYLSREKVLKAAGFTPEAAAQIAEAATKGDVQTAQTLVQTGWDNPEMRPDALKERESREAAADLASVEAYNSEAQRIAFEELDAEMQASWNEVQNPTGARAIRNEDGSWTVVDANEQVIDTTQDAEQAVELVKQVDQADAASMTAVVDDMIDYFKQRGRGGQIEVTGESRTLQDDVKAGKMTAENAQRIVDLYVSLGALPAGTKPKEARIYGESERRYNAREKVFEYVSRLHDGADPLVLVEEEAEGYFKAALDAAEFTLDQVEEWRATVEGKHIIRRQDEAMRKRENVEWFSTYAKAYLTGKAQADRSIPMAFRRWLEKMRQVFAEVFKLARDLVEMEQAGTLPVDFRTHLARSVGLDEAFIERRMRDEERASAQEGVADQYTAREALLKIKLPTPKKETAGMRGELMNLWESLKFNERMKLFSAKAKSLDAVAEVLRADYGFSWVVGPDEVVAMAEDTFLRGKDIRSDRSDFQEATGAVRKKAVDKTADIFDSGLAEEEFRLWGGTAEDATGAVDAEEARREAKKQADAAQGEMTFALRDEDKADRAEYDRLQSEMQAMGSAKMGTPEYQALWRQSEDIKNRHGGMPPGETAAESSFALRRAKPMDANAPQTRLPDGSRLVGPSTFAIRAYHGTPHKVDRFSTDKIGTGEGAQVYGWGLYFAENPSVAKEYRTQLSYKDVRDKFLKALAANATEEEVMAEIGTGAFTAKQERVLEALAADDWLGFDYPAQAISAAYGKLDNYDPSPELREAVADSGQLYTVDLLPEPDAFLNWDKSFNEQSEAVKSAIRAARQKASDDYFKNPDDIQAVEAVATLRIILDEQERRGEEVYRNISSSLGANSKKASEFLAAAGIPGIRYLDQGSRQGVSTGYIYGKNAYYWVDDGTNANHRRFPSGNTAESQAKAKADADAYAAELRSKLTYNYVIFDDKLVKILEENGQPVPAEQGQATFALRKQPSGELLAVHNTSAAKLRQMDELGGMAAPSIAVIKPGTSEYSSFGDITLIAPPEVIDPKRSAAAKVFNADVYSPRFPNTQYKINRKALDAAWKKLNDASGQLGNVLSSSLDEEAVSKDGLRAFKDAAVVKLAFLKSKGITPDIRMRKADPLPESLTRFTGKSPWEISDNAEFQKGAAAYYREAYKDYQDLLSDILDEQGQVMIGPLNRLARNVYDINNPEPDRYESNGAFQTQIEQAGLLDEFDAWVKREFGGVVTGKVVRDYNERTGDTRNLPYDLDTVVRVMKRDLRDGEGFNYGVGSIRATVAKQFRSLSAIREAAGNIQKKEAIEALKEETNDEFMALAEELTPFYRYDSKRFGYLDEVSQSFKELGQYNGAAKWAENFKDTPPELMQRVRDFMQKLANAPTEYFEAKVQRGVLLNELAGAVIPTGTPDDVREILRKNGLKFVEYPKGDEKARAAAVAGFTEQTFAIGPAKRADDVRAAMRSRMVGIRVQASTNFADEVKALVGQPQYEVRGMDVNEREAKKIIEKNDGDLTKLMDVLNDPTQTMHPATKVALAFFVAEAANKAGDYARAAEVAKLAAEMATSIGQGVNELKRWSVFTNPQTTQKLLQTEIEKENARRKQREPAIDAVVTVYADVQKEALKLLKVWLDEINGVRADAVQPVTADELAELADVTFALRADIKASGLVEQVAKLLKKHGAEATERALVEKYGKAVEQHLPDLFIEAQRTLTGRKKATKKAVSRIPEQDTGTAPSPRTPEEIEAAMDAQRQAGEGTQTLADIPDLYDRLFEHLMLRLKDANVPVQRGIREQVMEVLNRHGLQATEDDVKLIMGARALLPDMTPAQAEELAGFARRIASTPLDSFERGQQTMELFSYVHEQLAPYDLVDVAFGLWYANVLSSLITSARNITGNAGLLFLDQATETIFRNPKAYWPYLMELAKAAESGIEGAKPQAVNTMRTGQEGLQRSQTLADERRQGALESKTAPLAKVRAISRIATRFLAMQDLLFANTAYEMKARQVAWDQAQREVDAGTLKPEQVEERVSRMLNAATDQIQTFEDRAAVEWDNLMPEIQANYQRENWIKRRVAELRMFERDKALVGRALDFAQKATLDFEPEGLMGLLIGALGKAFTTAEKAAQEITDKRVRLVAKGAARYGRTRVIPFMRVPVNVFNRALDYGPVGYARALMDAMGVPVIVGTKTRTRTAEERSDLLKRATLGTLAMIPLALFTRPPDPDEDEEEYPWLQIHGAGSGTPQKNIALNGPKYRPYSLEIRVGGRQVFIDYRMAPVAPYLAAIGSLHDRTRYKKAVDDKSALVQGWMLAHALKEGFMASSPITSLRELSEAAAENNPMSERAVNRTLARGTVGIAGNLIPLSGFWRSLDQLAGGNRNTRDTLLAASLAEIPVASRANVPSVDVLGDVMTNRTGIGWLADWTKMETPESRIYMAFAEKDVTPSDLSRYQTKLTPEQYYELARERGAQIKTVMLTPAGDGKTGLERLLSLSDKPVAVGGDSPAKVFMRRLSDATTKRALEKTGLNEVLKPEVVAP